MARVLVIDDDAHMRRSLRRLLETAGHVVAEAGNGDQGLALFASEPIDLVVTDILMPDKEGIETIRELRQRAAVPILAISGASAGFGELDVLGFAQRLGADDALAKPFRARELLDKVASMLRGQ